MAYLLGYLYADGSLTDAPYMRGKYISATSTDRIMLERMKQWMRSGHTIVTLRRYARYPGKTRYIFRIGSHKIFDSLVRRGLYSNKSLTISFPFVPPAHLSHFVRGYLDGDGCIYRETGTGSKGQRILKRLAVIFTSGSPRFLQGLERVLRDTLNLPQKEIYSSHRSLQLRYSTHDSMKICNFIYHRAPAECFLKRKYDIYRLYLAQRNGAVVK